MRYRRPDRREIIWVREDAAEADQVASEADPVASDLAPREALLAHIADLTVDLDELRKQADVTGRHLAVISSVLGSQELLQIDDIAARLHILIAERDELKARPTHAAAPAQKAAVRAAVAAIYFADSSDYLGALWDVVRALRPDIAGLLGRNERAAFEAVKDDVAPEQAAPDHVEDARGMVCAGSGPDGCSDSVACPRAGGAA